MLAESEGFDIKGICDNPIPKGETYPEGLPFLADCLAYSLDPYDPNSNFEQSASRIQEVIAVLKSAEARPPVAINYEELPTKGIVDVDHDPRAAYHAKKELYNPQERRRSLFSRFRFLSLSSLALALFIALLLFALLALVVFAWS